MSLTHEQVSTTSSATPTIAWWRSIYFPLIVLAVFGSIFAIPWICIAAGVDTNELPPPPLMMSQWLAPLAAILLIAVWWLFLSTFGWAIRLSVAALVIAAGAGFFFSVRDVEMTKGRVSLVMRIHFRWETTADDRLAAHLANQATDDLPPIDARVGLEDFPRYRGANLDGVVRFARLNASWDKNPPKEQWSHPCPGGYSGVAVAGNIVVTLEQRRGAQTVVCCDRATGRQRWTYLLGSAYTDRNKMGDGPRSTPTIHDSRIYCIGATGEMVSLNVEGKKQWSVNILDDAKAKHVKWGMTASPLIVDDLVITNPGIDEEVDYPTDGAVIAYDQATGKIRWRTTGKRKASYSSPQLVKFAGVPQILLFGGDGLISYDKTGKELWQFPWVTDFSMNSIQPVVVGDDRVFISSEMSNGCSMLRVKAPENDKGSWSVETVWKNKNLAARYANPVSDGKSIFGLHNLQGKLICLDVETGKVKWRGGLEGPGQLLLTDGLLLVVNGDTGDVALFDEDGNEKARHQSFDKKDKTWNTPALAGDQLFVQLFVRNQTEIVCLKLPRR